MAILSYYRIYPTAGGNEYVWSTTTPTVSLTGGTLITSSTVVVMYINFSNTVNSITFAQSPYTALPTCGSVICDTTSGAINVNLPDTATVPGEVFYFTNTGTNSVTLTAFGSQTIDGSPTSTITSTGNRMLAIQCSGGNWTQAIDGTEPDPELTLNSTSSETNKTLTDPTNVIRCTQLATTGADVVITSGAAPTVGQSLIATSATTAAFGNVYKSITATRISGTPTAPTIPTCVKGTGAGNNTAGSATLLGSDIAGTVTVVTGITGASTAPLANQVIFTVTFSTPYTVAPYVIFSPMSQTASILGNTSRPFVLTPTTSSFTLNAGTAALPTNSIGIIYKWSYHVIG